MNKPFLRFSLNLFASAALAFAQPAVTGVVNAASYKPSLAPGTWAAIFGTSLTTGTATASAVPLTTALGGVTVTIGGVAAPLYYVSPTQINVVIPFEVKIPTAGTMPVVVTSSLGSSPAYGVTLTQDAPGLFTANGSGTGAALAFDANFKPVTSIGNTPIVLYATGLGPTTPAGSSNSGGVSAPPFNVVADPLTVLVGGTPATIGYAGLAPGFPGIYQLNVTPNSPYTNTVSINSVSGGSNVGTIGVTGANVTNVQGLIDGIYPATGANIAAEGASASGPGSSLGITLAFAGANFTLDFDVVPGAGPFSVAAVSDGGIAVINIDPVHGTWQGTLTSPTAAARNGDFSAILPTRVLDLATCDAQGSCAPLPGNVLPLSRFDPVFYRALPTIPLPNTKTAYNLAINGVTTVSGTLTGNHFHWDSSNGAFGGFSIISWNGPPPSVRTTNFYLYVDGQQVASKTATYRAY